MIGDCVPMPETRDLRRLQRGNVARLPMSRLARRLRRGLEREGLRLPAVVHIERTYAGRHQKAMGSWTWQLCDQDGRWLNVGSRHPAREVATAVKLSFLRQWPYTDVEVDIVPAGGTMKTTMNTEWS